LFLPFDLVLDDVVAIGNSSRLTFEADGPGSSVSVGKAGVARRVGQRLQIERKMIYKRVNSEDRPFTILIR
jgi:hypothetical protein